MSPPVVPYNPIGPLCHDVDRSSSTKRPPSTYTDITVTAQSVVAYDPLTPFHLVAKYTAYSKPARLSRVQLTSLDRQNIQIALNPLLNSWDGFVFGSNIPAMRALLWLWIRELKSVEQNGEYVSAEDLKVWRGCKEVWKHYSEKVWKMEWYMEQKDLERKNKRYLKMKVGGDMREFEELSERKKRAMGADEGGGGGVRGHGHEHGGGLERRCRESGCDGRVYDGLSGGAARKKS